MHNDVTYLAITLGLFALAYLLLVACDRLIGPDEAELGSGTADPEPAAAAAAGHEREAA